MPVKLPNPYVPGHTCPTLNEIISLVEEVREANHELRNAVNEWESYGTEAWAIIDELENENARLTEENEQLQKQVADLSAAMKLQPDIFDKETADVVN